MFQELAYDIEAVMLAAIDTGLFVSVCDIQAPDGLYGPSGAPSGNYVDVAGLTGLACTAPPPSIGRVSATEVKALEDISSMRLHHVLLTGWYPQIESQTDWRAVIDGTAYDIMGAESDSQHQMTRVQVKVVTL